MFISFLYHLKTGKQPFHKPASATYGHAPPPLQTLNCPFIYKTKLSTNKNIWGSPLRPFLVVGTLKELVRVRYFYNSFSLSILNAHLIHVHFWRGMAYQLFMKK